MLLAFDLHPHEVTTCRRNFLVVTSTSLPHSHRQSHVSSVCVVDSRTILRSINAPNVAPGNIPVSNGQFRPQRHVVPLSSAPR
jgi:hypothetical protein